MQKDAINILCINPGFRYLGIAIFIRADLEEWMVKAIGRMSPAQKGAKVMEIFSDIIVRYQINIMVIKKLHSSRSSKYLSHLSREIKKLGLRSGLLVYEHSIEKIKNILISSGRRNKRRMMEEVVRRYPLLHFELKRELARKNPYLIRMFEAVGLGIVQMGHSYRTEVKKSSANQGIRKRVFT